MRRCAVFWSHVQWDGRALFISCQFHVFLRSASKDLIRAAVDLFDKYMHTPVSEWDEYVHTGRARKKRREQQTDINQYGYLENRMQQIGVETSGTRIAIAEDINPTPQWRGEHVKLYTDGSYYPVWNVEAWAVVDVENNTKMSGGVLGAQTNNRAELTAMIAALSLILILSGCAHMRIMLATASPTLPRKTRRNGLRSKEWHTTQHSTAGNLIKLCGQRNRGDSNGSLLSGDR